ncbi:MAG: TonB-dependent receptor, partial [Betaproteobacteria bacterium HGW-Betaproteobacteria-21]
MRTGIPMRPKLHPLPLALLIAFACQSPLATADTDTNKATAAPIAAAGTSASKAASTAADSTSVPTPTLGSVVVSASALSLGVLEMSTPVSVLSGDQLVQDRAASLGETLSREPGIRSTHFGAGASRPIIRGMDGPRVKVLSDGAEVMDASTVSPDHAVAIEPMLSEQIEVLRGPSALAYGGGAIGGVVNVLDRKIPTAIPARGVEGSVELRANTAARETAGAFEVTAGAGNFAIHAEGLTRDASDYRVGHGWSEGRRVDGSDNKTESTSLGLSWIGDRGWLGLAYTHQRNEYGLPGHGHDLEDCHTHGDHLHCGTHGD